MKTTASDTEWTPRHIDIVSAGFVASILISNVLATKLFQCGPAIFTAGILVFPISYIFGDVLTEVYGFNRTRRIIYAGLAANLFMSAALGVAIILPPAQGWEMQREFAAVNSVVPRIVLASVVGYVVGEFANSFVMSRMKVRSDGQKLWMRAVASTVVGQLLDTMLFVLIAFAGSLPTGIMAAAIASGWIFKVLYEVAAIPITYMVVRKLKALEGVEHFDRAQKLTII